MKTRTPLIAILRSFWPALAIVATTNCVASPTFIPSGSMEPTMHAGDFLLVNRLAYSFHLPILSTAEIVRWSSPDRGDVVIFNAPPQVSSSEAMYIKRVVAVAGDVLEVRNHLLNLNGVRAAYQPVEGDDYTETLGRAQNKVHVKPSSLENFGPYLVPAGHIFVMGDNRDNSSDSRAWGPLALEHVRGQALFRIAGVSAAHRKALGPL